MRRQSVASDSSPASRDADARAAARMARFVGHPHRALWTLAWPMIAGFTVHALYSVVDSMFIGRLGAMALAGSGYIGALFFAAIAFTNGVATGITAAVARAFGAGDREEQSRIASTGLVFATLVGLIFSGLGLATARWLIPLLGARGGAAEAAWEYMLPLWLGMPLFFVSTAYRAVITAEGDARTPMVILALATGINLGLDPVFMFVLGWGVAGAGVATVCAQLVALVALLYVAYGRRSITSRISAAAGIALRGVGRIVAVGLPATAGHLIMALGMVLINRVVAHFGQLAVAGYVAATRVDMCVSLPLLGISSAAMTLTGMFFGARRPDLVRMTTVNAYRWSVLVAMVLGGAAYVAATPLVHLFVSEGAAVVVGRQYLGYALFMYPLMAVGMTTGRILQGLGWGWPTFVITAMRVLVVGATCAYVAVYVFDASLRAVWLSLIAGGVSAALLAWYFVRSRLWAAASAGEGML